MFNTSYVLCISKPAHHEFVVYFPFLLLFLVSFCFCLFSFLSCYFSFETLMSGLLLSYLLSYFEKIARMSVV